MPFLPLPKWGPPAQSAWAWEINATDAEGLIKGNACLGGDSCCVNGNCGVGEGDCDSDSDCKPGIKFYQLYCNYFFHILTKRLLTLAFMTII